MRVHNIVNGELNHSTFIFENFWKWEPSFSKDPFLLVDKVPNTELSILHVKAKYSIYRCCTYFTPLFEIVQ